MTDKLDLDEAERILKIANSPHDASASIDYATKGQTALWMYARDFIPHAIARIRELETQNAELKQKVADLLVVMANPPVIRNVATYDEEMEKLNMRIAQFEAEKEALSRVIRDAASGSFTFHGWIGEMIADKITKLEAIAKKAPAALDLLEAFEDKDTLQSWTNYFELRDALKAAGYLDGKPS